MPTGRISSVSLERQEQVFHLRPEQIKMTASCFIYCCSLENVSLVTFVCQQIFVSKCVFLQSFFLLHFTQIEPILNAKFIILSPVIPRLWILPLIFALYFIESLLFEGISLLKYMDRLGSFIFNLTMFNLNNENDQINYE